ncbi:hypothetical protein Ahy_B01g052651 isoform C [Arachis hypogaea]|uniref:Uncharacterized protein n=1 Tax=Arachis hypogaea TaxID=3818 RepID=A0A445APZ4_ARAHY|nr:hypothetical protein Ahy_B01g052651 isoform C [Arachis hypogaea]
MSSPVWPSSSALPP